MLTFLAHREHLHTAFSGLQFILTLGRAACRKKLCIVAKSVAPIADRLLRARGHGRLSVTEYIKIGNAMHKVVVLAHHKGRKKTMGSYHSMDAIRCFECVCRFLLRSQATPYTSVVHQWILKKQSSKFRKVMLKDLFYFGIQDAACMVKAVQKYAKLHAKKSVIPTTTFVLYCEVRQVINRFTLKGAKFLCEAYEKSKAIRETGEELKEHLLEKDDGADSHTVQVFQAIADHVKFKPSLALHVTATPTEVIDACAKHGLCPKLALEGIPEWISLRNVLQGILVNCTGKAKYADVTATAKSFGVSVFDKEGNRKPMPMLQRQVTQARQQSTLMPSRKRTWVVLENEMRSKGGNPSPYVGKGPNRKRKRMRPRAIEKWLEVATM